MSGPYVLLAKVLLVLGLAGSAVAGYQWWAEAKRDEGRQEVRAEIALEREARKDADARETARRVNEQGKAQREHEAQLARARSDAAAARDAAGRLSRQLAAFAAAYGRPADPAAAGGSAPAGDPIGVLANVLGRADERAGILAEYADRARAAGQLCERAYEALTVKP